jgi:hypothetical protein
MVPDVVPFYIMGKTKKLYKKALESQNNYSYRDLCSLAEGAGFKPKKKASTSHQLYNHPKLRALLNFQPVKGSKQAKPIQVKQLLDIIDRHGLLKP